MLSLTKSAYHEDATGAYLVGGFKTEAGADRLIPLSPKIQPIVRALASRKDSLYLFPREDGGLMRDAYFRDNLFYPLLASLNIQPLPDKDHPATYVPYSCRHTFANLMKNISGSDKDKAALMGHSDAAMTKYYQSADLNSLRNITNAL